MELDCIFTARESRLAAAAVVQDLKKRYWTSLLNFRILKLNRYTRIGINEFSYFRIFVSKFEIFKTTFDFESLAVSTELTAWGGSWRLEGNNTPPVSDLLFMTVCRMHNNRMRSLYANQVSHFRQPWVETCTLNLHSSPS